MNAKTEAKGEKPANTKSTDNAEKGSNAPRPRKWDYGIIPEATIVRLKDDEKVKGVTQDAWDMTKGNKTTVAKFMEKGNRHDLRVLSRNGCINIVHADGTKYPQKYVAPAPKPKTEKKAASKAA